MRIGILGTGNVARTLEEGWAGVVPGADGATVAAARTVRRSHRYAAAVAFYRDVVRLPVVHLAEDGPDGHGVAILGLPGTAATFELVPADGPVPVDRHEQLVLYFPGPAARDAVARRLRDAGHEPVAQNRYWTLNDAVTFHDPDGRELVLAPWVFGAEPPPMRRTSPSPPRPRTDAASTLRPTGRARSHGPPVSGPCEPDGMTTMPDGRTVPPPQADERATLESWLDFHRATLVLKCAGLDDAQVRHPAVEPSTMTLLGLVQHMAEVERKWFQRVFAGHVSGRVFPGQSDGFTLSPDRGIDEALAAWRAEVERGRAAIADASLDDCGTLSDAEAAYAGDKRISLRWILVHMIEEYARHNGHADLLREALDGATGA